MMETQGVMVRAYCLTRLLTERRVRLIFHEPAQEVSQYALDRRFIVRDIASSSIYLPVDLPHVEDGNSACNQK